MLAQAAPRVVVGITGASGAAYGVRLLERLRELQVYTHLVATPAGVLNVHHELSLDRPALEALADEAHAPGDIGACIASGSHATAAMVVAPCSMKSLAAIAHGFGDNLLTRAAADTAAPARSPARLIGDFYRTTMNTMRLTNLLLTCGFLLSTFTTLAQDAPKTIYSYAGRCR